MMFFFGRFFLKSLLFMVLLPFISLPFIIFPATAQAMPDEFAKAASIGSISKKWDCYYQMNTWHTCPKKIVDGRWLLEPAIPEPILLATAEFEVDEPGRIFLHGSAQCDNCTQLDYSLQNWNGQRWINIELESGNLVTVCRTGESCPDKEYPYTDALPQVKPGTYRLQAHTGISLAGSGWTFYPETQINISASFLPDKAASKGAIRIVTIKGDNAVAALSTKGTERVRCSTGMELQPGSTITNGTDTETIIDMGGQSLVRLGPLSELRLNKFVVSSGSISAKATLKFGELKGRVAPESDLIDLSITTPTSTIGIRGTEFGIRYDQRFRATEIQVGSGKVTATCPNSSEESIIHAGQWAVIASGCTMNSGKMSTSEIIALSHAIPQHDTIAIFSKGQDAAAADTIATVPPFSPQELVQPYISQPAPPQPTPPPLPDVLGSWRLTQANGYPGSLVIVKQEGASVSGTLSWDNFATAPITGILQEDHLELVADYGSGLTGTYQATLSPDAKELLEGSTTSFTGETISWSGTLLDSPPKEIIDEERVDKE